jgi:hypothetical protein
MYNSAMQISPVTGGRRQHVASGQRVGMLRANKVLLALFKAEISYFETWVLDGNSVRDVRHTGS